MKTETKRCSKCRQVKSVSEFAVSKQHPDGYRATCKECHNEYHRKYRQKNGEKVRQITDRSYAKHRAEHLRRKQLRRASIVETCVICSKHGRMYHHHQDYAVPNQVDVLCQSCHGRIHAAVKVLLTLNY